MGFTRIRHYGLLAASHATTTLETAREHADAVHAKFVEHLGDDQRPLPAAS